MNKFCLDTNIIQQFDYIKRPDLIRNILPNDTASLIITDALRVEITDAGSGFQQAFNFENQTKPVLILVSSSTSTSLRYQDELISFLVENANTLVDTLNIPTLQDFPTLPKPDRDMLILGQIGYKLLTNDYRHIHNYGSKLGVLCTGGVGILIANVLTGNLSPPWAGRYYQMWRRYDQKWIPKKFDTFSKIFRSKIDQEKIKIIFNLQ